MIKVNLKKSLISASKENTTSAYSLMMLMDLELLVNVVKDQAKNKAFMMK